jgi:hypothetical protein
MDDLMGSTPTTLLYTEGQCCLEEKHM